MGPRCQTLLAYNLLEQIQQQQEELKRRDPQKQGVELKQCLATQRAQDSLTKSLKSQMDQVRQLGPHGTCTWCLNKNTNQKKKWRLVDVVCEMFISFNERVDLVLLDCLDGLF